LFINIFRQRIRRFSAATRIEPHIVQAPDFFNDVLRLLQDYSDYRIFILHLKRLNFSPLQGHPLLQECRLYKIFNVVHGYFIIINEYMRREK